MDPAFDGLQAALAERMLDTVTEECGWCGMWPARLSRDTLLCRRCDRLPGARAALLASLELERATPVPEQVPVTDEEAAEHRLQLLHAIARRAAA